MVAVPLNFELKLSFMTDYFFVNAVPGKRMTPSSSRPPILLKLDSSVCGDCGGSELTAGRFTCGEEGFSAFELWSLRIGESVAVGVSLRLDWRSVC